MDLHTVCGPTVSAPTFRFMSSTDLNESLTLLAVATGITERNRQCRSVVYILLKYLSVSCQQH